MFGLRLLVSGAILLILCAAHVHEARAEETVPLPVRSVELYKNGMGFFEHRGSVRDSQSVEIQLPGSQLNDVLKSLTVLDPGKGQIVGVTYDSVAPVERRLAEIPINPTSVAGIASFLNQIRGAGVEITTPSGVAAGKLLAVETQDIVTGPGVTGRKTIVSLLSGDGLISVVELESAGALRLTDQALAGDLNRGLDIIDSSHQRDVRKLRIQTYGDGERQIYIGYTSETPIWKTTYRIVLDPKQKPLLQGWAIVDNTTPMDWNDVSLSLVAGAPISFIQNLSQPIYGRRPVVPVAQGIQVTPQTSEAAISTGDVGAGSGTTASALRGSSGFVAPATAPSDLPPPPLSASASTGVLRTLTTPVDATMSRGVGDAQMMRQSIMTALAQAIGEQFEYRLRRPVTIRRNESALLPILQSDIGGEKVAVFNLGNGEANPRLAFRLENSSGLTLDGGAVTVIDSNAFAGEGLFETIQPGETRLVEYAIDQGTEVSAQNSSEQQRVDRVVIRQGTMRLYSGRVEKTVYRIRNNNDVKRVLIIEHPIRENWKLTSAAPEETSANFYRFRVEVPAKSTTEFTVQEESPVENVYALSPDDPRQFDLWLRSRAFFDPDTEKLLLQVTDKRGEVFGFDEKIASLEDELTGIFNDQTRVRNNLQSLGQASDETMLRQIYINRLHSQEDRIEAIKTEREKLEAGKAAAQKQLEDLIRNLNVDKKL